MKYSIVCFLLVTFFSCKKEKDIGESENAMSPLFSLVPAKESGINFKNRLPESEQMNRFVYEYYYNGGGVAIGDVNNDGLEDIYFTSNLKDNKLYLNKGNFTFEDITDKAGVQGKTGWATGVTMVDIDQDGKLDIYVCRSGRFADENVRRNELFVNQGVDASGNPLFIEKAADYGLDDPSFSTQALFLDYDRDGDLDMFLGNHHIEAPPTKSIAAIMALRQRKSKYGGDKLYQNQKGTFVDVSAQAGIVNNQMSYTLGLSASDLNNDGWVDVYIANDYSDPDYIYINNTDGTFKETARKSLRQMPNFSMGSDMGDINNDGYTDILSLDMVAKDNYGIKTSMSGMDTELFYGHVDAGLQHQYMYNALQLNNGIDNDGLPRFSNIAQMAGVSNTYWSWAGLLADFDNDGFQDIFITNGIKRDFRNNDFNIFLKKATQEVVDNKKNPLPYYKQWTGFSPKRPSANYVLQNNGDLTFTDRSDSWGTNQDSFSNGAAYADLDNDGDLDLVVNNVDDDAFLYRNNSENHTGHKYVKVELKGFQGNTNAIGTRVTLFCDELKQTRQLFPASVYQSSVSNKVHFGVGEHTKIDSMEILWPNGKMTVKENIATNQTLKLEYANARLTKPKTTTPKKKGFVDLAHGTMPVFGHGEKKFNDFERESLLPHKMSQMGPALATGDINGDGLDDFFIGGGPDQAGAVYLQNGHNGFDRSSQPILDEEKKYEDTAALLFDMDGDGDEDLCVAGGSNEHEIGSTMYRPRFYENKNGEFYRATTVFPDLAISSSCIRAADYDNDGDKDLFIGGRQIPGKYPMPASSFILRNDGKMLFADVTREVAPMLKHMGMVTDALWNDIDADGKIDLVLCGEWMPITVLKNKNGQYKDETATLGLSKTRGWWNTLQLADMDNDGDLDLLAGNLGLNYKYKATPNSPFEIFARDFDGSGSLDIVLGYHQDNKLFPLRGRECSSRQMPFIKQKFPSYDAFGKATMNDIFGSSKLDSATHYKATTFATTYFENKNGDTFVAHPLNNEAQLSSVNSMVIDDFNADGALDMLLAGNLYGSEVETPRNDAGYGVCLMGNGNGKFTPLMPHETGLLLDGEVKHVQLLKSVEGRKLLIAAKNNAPFQLLEVLGLDFK